MEARGHVFQALFQFATGLGKLSSVKADTILFGKLDELKVNLTKAMLFLTECHQKCQL